jgi:hypothetical protein
MAATISTEEFLAPITAEMDAIADLEQRIRQFNQVRFFTQSAPLEAERSQRVFKHVQLGSKLLVYPLDRTHFYMVTNRINADIPAAPADYWELTNHCAKGNSLARLCSFILDRRAVWVEPPADWLRVDCDLDYITINPAGPDGEPCFVAATYI